MGEFLIIKGVSCYEENGKAYLRLEDVARGLGFTQSKNGIEYIRWETINKYLEDIGFPNKLGKDDYIQENIFYRLAMKAKNETAEKFQALVADEIIPSIRRTGGYVANDEMFIQTYLPFADENTKALFRTTLHTISEQNKLIQKQQDKIQQDKPLVEFAEHVSESVNSIDMSTFAKLLYDENIKIGRNRLFAWMKKNKYLMRDTKPYQKYVDYGYFELKEQTYKTPYGEKRVGTKTMITGKGQIYFTEKLRKEFSR